VVKALLIGFILWIHRRGNDSCRGEKRMKKLISGILCVAILFAVSIIQTQAQEKTIKVKIYLLDVFESENLLETLAMQPVEREVSAKNPLRFALEELMKGATEEENSQLRLYSTASEISLISVRVKNKTAYANFTRKTAEGFDKIAALRFRKAVRQTALQFKNIRRIEICLDGIADFWRIGAKTHKKCS
jgi:hypothetical protein